MSVRGVLIRFDSTDSLSEQTTPDILTPTPRSPNFLRSDYFDGGHGSGGHHLHQHLHRGEWQSRERESALLRFDSFLVIQFLSEILLLI